jgi:hypothetical protein
VVVPKKNGKLRLYVDLKKLNATTKKDPYPLPFMDEVINTTVGHKVYTFLDKFSKYHQVSITLETNTKLVLSNWGAFVWVMMPFGVKNGLPTY